MAKEKILITGMNKNQCTEDFYLRQQLQVVPSHYSLLRCLRDMGYEVEQRVVELGEDLSAYKHVLVFLAGPKQRQAITFYNGLYAIANREDSILLFDDWQTKGIYDSIVKTTKKELFNKWNVDLACANDRAFDVNVAKQYESKLLHAIDLIRCRQSRLLISAFDCGDLSLLSDWPSELTYSYNPNPYHLNRQGKCLFEKQKTFNFASLLQGSTISWLKKQKIENWPIEYFGSKKDGQRRLTEDKMCDIFAEQWGCLMPGYKHAGSGWWRARPLQVADAGSILIGDYSEMMLYYDNEDIASLKASDVEKMNDAELESVAKAQRDLLYARHPLDKFKQQMEMNICLIGSQ